MGRSRSKGEKRPSSRVRQSGNRVTLNDKRKVFVQRDYSKGLIVKFYNDHPDELVGKIDERQFHKIIDELNVRFEEAERVGTESICETLLGCVTCYLVRFCVDPRQDRLNKEILEYIDNLNTKVLVPRGLHLGNPFEKGLRVLEFTLIYEKNEPQQSSYQNSVVLPTLEPR